MHIEPDKKSVITTNYGKQISSVVYTDYKFAKRIIERISNIYGAEL